MLAGCLCECGAVRADDGFAAKRLAPFQCCGDAQVRAGVYGTYELEVCDKFWLLAGCSGTSSLLLRRILLSACLLAAIVIHGLGKGRDELPVFGREAMRGGERAADEMLGTVCDVEDCRAAGDMEPLVAVADEEVRVQSTQVDFDVANAVGAIDAAQDAQFLAFGRQTLKRQADARHADYGVEDCDFDFSAFGLDVSDLTFELLDEPVVFEREGVLDLYGLRGRGLGNVRDGSLAGTVDVTEDEDVVFWGEDEVAQDNVYTRGGVGDEDQRGRRRVE